MERSAKKQRRLPVLSCDRIVQNRTRVSVDVVKQIFAYASPSSRPYRPDLMPHESNSLRERVPKFAKVSRGWKKMVLKIIKKYTTTTPDFHFVALNDDSEELFLIDKPIQEREDLLLDLRLSMGRRVEQEDETDDFGVKLYKPLDTRQFIENIQLDWDSAVFERYRTLQCLDLSFMPLRSVQMEKILNAVSTYCPSLQALTLPLKEHEYLSLKELKRTFAALYRALQRWHKGGLRRGLTQLTVPYHFNYSSSSLEEGRLLTDEFVRTVVKFCPNLEYFNEWKRSCRDGDVFECDDVLYCLVELRVLKVKFSGEFIDPKKIRNDFGDSFLELVADHCPLLGQLVIKDVSYIQPFYPLRDVTDAGLAAISRLPRLHKISLKEAGASVKGFLALFLNRPAPQDKRKIFIDVEGIRTYSSTDFYQVVADLLEALTALPAGTSRQHRFCMTIQRRTDKQLEDSVLVKTKIEEFNQVVRTLHSNIKMRIPGATPLWMKSACTTLGRSVRSS